MPKLGIDVARSDNVKKQAKSVDCYIAVHRATRLDPALAERKIPDSLVMYAIPSLGVLFRARRPGSDLELEFEAFFALTKFVKESLHEHGVKQLRVLSSNADFVFAAAGRGKYLQQHPQLKLRARRHSAGLTLKVAYVSPIDNRCRVSASEFPSLPRGQKLPIEADR
jgi:hypothetical protein